MYKKLTITVEEEIYEGLHRVIGRGAISQFIAELVRPHVVGADLDTAYADMAADEARERDALAWSEALAVDVLEASEAPRERPAGEPSQRKR